MRPGILILCMGLQAATCHAADLEEIVRKGAATIRMDWAADPDYAYVERDETRKNEKLTRKTSLVVMFGGSDYYLPLAVDDEPLTPQRQKAELQKLRNEVRRRNSEDAASRERRVAKYKKQHDENAALALDFPNAFSFELLREEEMNGYPAYVLSGTARPRTGPLSLAAKVLSGMRGTVWIDKEHFHAIHADCTVVKPVPIYGILARVMPGTHIEFEMAPVSDSVWLIRKISMALNLSKFLLFKSTQVTISTFTEYRLNSAVLEELLAKAGEE